MSDNDEARFRSRLGAMEFAEEQEDRARALGLDAHTAGWDDDRVSIAARDIAVLLDAYELRATRSASPPARRTD